MFTWGSALEFEQDQDVLPQLECHQFITVNFDLTQGSMNHSLLEEIPDESGFKAAILRDKFKDSTFDIVVE